MSVTDLIQILNPIGNATVTQIQQNLAASGENASGKTSRSLTYTVTQEGEIIKFQITGRPFFMTVETGRKATPNYKPSKSFVATIQDWMKAKGLPGPAYAIALSIHQKGTKLWQSGGRKDIVSNVINESLYSKISEATLNYFVNRYLQVIDNNNSTSTRA